MAVLVFQDGHTLRVTADGTGVASALEDNGQIASVWKVLHTDKGAVLVNPVQVAYIVEDADAT
jgi:hypothetical protein